MRLPRRVPWRSSDELEQVYKWLFAAEANDSTKQAALDRLAAWRCATQLPHAIESTWMILSVLLRDSGLSSQRPDTSSLVVVRQSYALAIVRLVNGLVDPLQQGMYARPISSIAAQIGLPSWLVEVRHAATHEDLPSLSLLREAAAQSLTWLHEHYWMPTIVPTNDIEAHPIEVPSLEPLLKEYKALVKVTIRDASLKTRHKSDLVKQLRNLERWIGEARVAYGLGQGQVDEEEKERWALSQLCEQLVQRGALIPSSKKRRGDPSTASLDTPSNADIWDQLLDHTRLNHDTFPLRLLSHLISRIIASDGSDPSEDACLSSWVLWAVRSWGDLSPDCVADDVAFLILTEASQSDLDEHSRRERIRVLVGSLPIRDETTRTKYLALLDATIIGSPIDQDIDMDIMEARVQELTSLLRDREDASKTEATNVGVATDPSPNSVRNPAPGIRLLGPELGWRPCPIGYNGLTMTLA